jgi:hypothetical protein
MLRDERFLCVQVKSDMMLLVGRVLEKIFKPGREQFFQQDGQ